MNPRSKQNLENDHDVDCQTYAMMWIGQASLGANCEPSQHKYHSHEEEDQYLGPNM
jgi:hypothetical protein